MRKCRFCHGDIQDASRVCEHCGRELAPPVPPPVVVEPAPAPRVGWSSPLGSDAETAVARTVRVSVVDINMPFPSMVGFMIKWALAAIPAFVILAVIGAVLVGMLAALGFALR